MGYVVPVTIVLLLAPAASAQTERDTLLRKLDQWQRQGTAAASAHDEVVALLDHEDAMVRQVACRTLGHIGHGDRATAAILGREIERGNPYHAFEALQALRRFGPAAEPAIPALGRALAHSDALIRGAAAEVLGAIGPAAGTLAPKVIELWRDAEATVREQALRSTEAMGQGALAALRGALASKEEDTQYTAAWHLRKLGVTVEAPPTDEFPTRLKQVSQSEFPAPGGRTMRATRHAGDARPDELHLHVPVNGGWKLARKLEGLPQGEGGFEPPQPFRRNGHSFLYVSLRIAGTGAMHEDTILWIAPDLSLHDVPFTPAPEAVRARLAAGERIWKGESNTFGDGVMSFHFFIWKEGDGNCCPSAGEGAGNYVLHGAARFDAPSKSWKHSFRIAPGAWRRLPAQP